MLSQISCWSTNSVVEILMAVVMIVLIVGLYRTKQIKEKGIGPKVIQFLCIGLLLPTIILLGVSDKLKGETIGTLLGGIAGYVLSSLSNEDKPKPNEQNSNKSSPPPDTEKLKG